jgi:hypothetical protein
MNPATSGVFGIRMRAGPGCSDVWARVWLAGQITQPGLHATQTMKDVASRETLELAASSESGSRHARLAKLLMSLVHN